MPVNTSPLCRNGKEQHKKKNAKWQAEQKRQPHIVKNVNSEAGGNLLSPATGKPLQPAGSHSFCRRWRKMSSSLSPLLLYHALPFTRSFSQLRFVALCFFIFSLLFFQPISTVLPSALTAPEAFHACKHIIVCGSSSFSDPKQRNAFIASICLHAELYPWITMETQLHKLFQER